MKRLYIVFLIAAIFASMFYLFSGCSFVQEDLLLTTKSPNNAYTVEAYKTNGGATVDYSIKVYLINNNNKLLIYDKYHDYDADIKWINNDIIYINGITLDLSKGETYDWRKDES